MMNLAPTKNNAFEICEASFNNTAAEVDEVAEVQKDIKTAFDGTGK